MTAHQYQITQICLFLLMGFTFALYVHSTRRNHWIARAFIYSIMFIGMLAYYHVQPSTSDYVDMVSKDHMDIYYPFYHCKGQLKHATAADSLHLILTDKCRVRDIKDNFKL